MTMASKLKRLFPPEAVIVEADKEMWNMPLSPEEETLIKSAVEKRKREFRAGRHAAHRALAQLDAPKRPLLRGDKREPLWPTGYLGSITHCRDACVAVCAKTEDMISLGVDVEPLKPLPEGVEQYVHTPEDKRTMAKNGSLPERLIFSAKESLYKCYYPLLGQFIGFQEVSLAIDVHEQTFQFTPAEDCTTPFPGEFAFHGRYLVEENHLYTGCFLTAPD